MGTLIKKLFIATSIYLITFYAIWPVGLNLYFQLSPENKLIINTAATCLFITVLFCLVGYYFDVRRTSLRTSVKNKIKNLEWLTLQTREIVDECENKLMRYYYHVDTRTIEKLAPAKWILSSLEQRLHVINTAVHLLSDKKLNKLLDQQIKLSMSPVNVLVFSETLYKLPQKANLAQCQEIIETTIKTVRQDICDIDQSYSQKFLYAYFA